jgi:Rne/Rng family ribonuclease
MANELIINASLPETRIALMEDGEIQDLLIERASGKGIVGNIYKGRVTRVLPGMQAAFVDIGLEKAAFLYVDDVYVHSEIWEEEEGPSDTPVTVLGEDAVVVDPVSDVLSISSVESLEPSGAEPHVASAGALVSSPASSSEGASEPSSQEAADPSSAAPSGASTPVQEASVPGAVAPQPEPPELARLEALQAENDGADEEETSASGSSSSSDSGQGSVLMGPPPESGSGDSKGAAQGAEASPVQPEGTLAPPVAQAALAESPSSSESPTQQPESVGQSSAPESIQEPATTEEPLSGAPSEDGDEDSAAGGRRRHRRGRRGGKVRSKKIMDGTISPPKVQATPVESAQRPVPTPESLPESYHAQVAETGHQTSDRSDIGQSIQSEARTGVQAVTEAVDSESASAGAAGRPQVTEGSGGASERRVAPLPAGGAQQAVRAEFKAQRSRDRRIRPKATVTQAVRGQVNIQDLLKEGQEVLVQIAKDPIATKGARLTCHISLPGRHLVCMPTIDHVGVSRRIEREDERRRLREYVERNRPRRLGFIVRTASGKQQSEKRIKQDIDYLTRLWSEIKEKAASVSAPALVYEDLNSVLRAIRDWVNEDIDKVMVDSRQHFGEIQRFVSHFMPSLKQKVELYHGDIPIFDAYNISTELSRALERKVWLKSGGYIVIDQAEALVAIDVNTGRYVGKKNLEDTILKINLEAVQEIAYQLRLRNCGGIIILDLIDMERDENKQRVYRALEDALSKDRARPTILKISELGLVEMTRKRTRDTIVRSLCESCTHCEGKGFIKSKQTVAYEVLREIERMGIDRDIQKVLIQAHADVIDILAIEERETLDQMEKRYRKSIYLQAITDFHSEQFEVTGDKVSTSASGRDRSTHESRHRSHEKVSGQHSSSAPRTESPASESASGSRDEGQKESKGASAPAERESRHHRDRGQGRGHHRSERATGGHRDHHRDRRDRDRHSGEGRSGVSSGAPVAKVSVQVSGNTPLIQPQPAAAPAPTVEWNDDNRGNLIPPGGSGSVYPSPQLAVLTVPSVPAGAVGNNLSLGTNAASSEGDLDSHYEEEDRLAFLRAQAAQDAALARLGTGGAHHAAVGGGRSSGELSRMDRNGGGGNGGNRRNPRQGRRGGRFRRGSGGGGAVGQGHSGGGSDRHRSHSGRMDRSSGAGQANGNAAPLGASGRSNSDDNIGNQ